MRIRWFAFEQILDELIPAGWPVIWPLDEF